MCKKYELASVLLLRTFVNVMFGGRATQSGKLWVKEVWHGHDKEVVGEGVFTTGAQGFHVNVLNTQTNNANDEQTVNSKQ